MLYAAAISWTVLLFQVINIAVPDPAIDAGYRLTSYYETLRGALSWLFVTLPIYLFSMRYLRKDYTAHPEKLSIWIRKWLVYFTLFVAALIIIGDIVFLFNSFLDGELTSRFFLKITAVLLIAGSIFGYYFWDIRQEEVEHSKKAKYLVYGVIAAFIISIVGGVVIAGSPQKQRALGLDRQRVQELQQIENAIVTYWRQKDTLPESLDPIDETVGFYGDITDPETTERYTYRITGDLSFELCAEFDLSSNEDPGFNDRETSRWRHDAGEACFTRTIDPDIEGGDITPRPAKPILYD
jgi:hypothetical protein